MENNVMLEDVQLVIFLETVGMIKILSVPKCQYTISAKKLKDVKIAIYAKHLLHFVQLHAISVPLAKLHPQHLDQEIPVSPVGAELVIFQDIVDPMSILIAELFYQLSIVVHQRVVKMLILVNFKQIIAQEVVISVSKEVTILLQHQAPFTHSQQPQVEQ